MIDEHTRRNRKKRAFSRDSCRAAVTQADMSEYAGNIQDGESRLQSFQEDRNC